MKGAFRPPPRRPSFFYLKIDCTPVCNEMMGQMTAMRKKVAPKPRCVSLAKSPEGKSLDWRTAYEAEKREFVPWLSDAINDDREGDAVTSPEGIRKVTEAIENLMAFASLKLDHSSWEGPVTMRWLSKLNRFTELYGGYTAYMATARGNNPTNIAKFITDVLKGAEWSAKQDWDGPGSALQETDREALYRKIRNLHKQWEQKATKVNRKRIREPMEEGLTLEMVIERADMLKEKVLSVDKDPSEMTDKERLAALNCLMIRFACRGGRNVDLHQISVVKLYSEEELLALVESKDLGGTYLIGPDPWKLLILDSKDHVIAHVVESEHQLINLVMDCFPLIECWEKLFRPDAHGCRSTRATATDQFQSATSFADFFEGVATRELGLEIRPYDIRRLNAIHLQRINASEQVRDSHSALMGTGRQNLEGAYDRRSVTEKAFLASEVQRWQFSAVYSAGVQNRVMPALQDGDVNVVLARLIRKDDNGEDLLALFCSDAIGKGLRHMELSQCFVRTNITNKFASGCLIVDHKGRQHWRAEDQSIARAQISFAAMGLNMTEFAVKSMVREIPAVQIGDIVYVTMFFTIGEIVSTSTSGLHRIRLAKEVKEMPTSTTQAHYRFHHDASIAELTSGDVLWPIDLTFIANIGAFQLRKSAQMKTV